MIAGPIGDDAGEMLEIRSREISFSRREIAAVASHEDVVEAPEQRPRLTARAAVGTAGVAANRSIEIVRRTPD